MTEPAHDAPVPGDERALEAAACLFRGFGDASRLTILRHLALGEHRVVDLTEQGEAIERELALVKVVGKGDHRVEAMRLAAAFGARTLDASLTSFVFELTGTTDEVERFIKLMTVVGLTEVSRTGIAAMSRGPDAM